MDHRIYWVGFNMVRGIGSVRVRALIDYFGTLQRAWEAPADALREAGIPQKSLQNLITLRKEVDLLRIWQKIQDRGIQVMTWDDEMYPPRLKQIDQPPPVLYIRGEILPEDHLAIAVVGTRRVTAYGRQVAEELGACLGANGVTVVSGLARGVDAIAHDSALKAGGRTIAVLGCGVDRIYPPEHTRLAEKIIERGAVISDYAPGTPPDSVNFPPRNRIISGFSMAVVVVEAGETSGALITSAFAADQGRDVYAVPGNINAPQSKGTNRLIQQGAKPLLHVNEVIEDLSLESAIEKTAARKIIPASDLEAAILGVLSSEPQYIDEISVSAGLSIEKVSATLTLMELKGMVRQVGGMNYVAIHEQPAGYIGRDVE
jgi:DNA processing protein